ncbi:hypothetical protein AVP43_02355 [Geobacillus stearothermophilus]|nr:hypothetical protein AVP43_02355 [Geobacillus stearothermophilus]
MNQPNQQECRGEGDNFFEFVFISEADNKWKHSLETNGII